MSLVSPEIPSKPDCVYNMVSTSVRRHAFLGGDQVENRRVEVARARSHDQAFERRHPHRSVHRVAAADGGGRAAVAQVQGDHIGLVAREFRSVR